MKLKDAIFEMKPGDKLNIHGLDELNPYTVSRVGVLSSSDGRHVVITKDNLNLDGEIIRAEPEVLAAEEIRHEYSMLCAIAQPMHKEIEDYGEACINNGQIKEWKRLKPLIDAVVRVLAANRVEGFHDMCFLDNAVANITPPWVEYA